MPAPAIAAILGLFSAISRLAENFWIGWFMVLAVLIGDASLANTLGFSGVVGSAISAIVNFVLGFFGISIIITSFQVLVLVAVSPLVLYVINRSAEG